MNIIVQDSKTGKEFMIRGHQLDFEIFQRSKGKVVDGELKGKGNWVTCRNYPSTIESAVAKCIQWILADPDDPDVVVVEAEKVRTKIAKVIKDRVGEIVVEVHDDRQPND